MLVGIDTQPRGEKRGNFKRLQSEAYRDMPKVKIKIWAISDGKRKLN